MGQRANLRTNVMACTALVGTALAVLATPASASIVWDEVGNGDFSNSGPSPTQIPTLAIGDNTIFGNCGESGGSPLDRDYFTITVPAGAELTAINLVLYEGADQTAFMGMVFGNVMNVDPDNAQPSDLAGFVLFGPPLLNQDVLGRIGSSLVPPTFSAPLPAGQYTFWVQQLNDVTDYGFTFVVVPGPGVLGLAGAAMVMGLRRGGSRRRSR